MFLSSAAKGLVPIFPHRFEAALPKDCGYFGRRALIAYLELPGRKLVFPVLEFRGDDAAADCSVQVLAALSSIAAGFGMASGTHHRHA